MAETRVCYLYGVTTDGSQPGHQVPGIDKAPVTMLAGDGIAALASALPSERFGPHAWHDHADDVLWLSNVARDHHEVLQHAAANIDVVPLRVPTVFADEERARDMLAAQLVVLRAALSRISGRLEWGVKVFDGKAGKEPDPPRPWASSGRAYLAGRLDQAREREEQLQQRTAAVSAIYEALSAAAVEARLNRPQDSSLHGRSEPMVLNAAYLLGRTESEPFMAVADQMARTLLHEHGLHLEVTGPWPPYNFAELGT